MTPNKVIERVNCVKTHAFSEEDQFVWLSTLDGMVKRIVMQKDESVNYEYPKDMDTELLIPAPFENLYVHYVMSMIDLYNKDFVSYNNALLVFTTQFEEYKKAYIRENRPKSAGGFKNTGW